MHSPPRRSLFILLATTFVTWIGTRMTAVALPLVALEETGEAWMMGLVGGMAGLPLLTVAWWGRSLRERLDSGRAIAAVMTVQAVGLLVVPLASSAGLLGVVALCVSGLVTGAAGALLGPAQRAIIADFADAEGSGTASAAQWLAWQDLAHRVSMIFAPPAGAWLVVVWGAESLLWCEAAVVLVAALCMLAVPTAETSNRPEPRLSVLTGLGPAPKAIAVLRAHPDVAAGIFMAGAGGVSWFGFSLGLAILGVEYGMPGALIAAGMAGYGAASVLTAFLVPWVIDRLPAMPTMTVSWIVLGLTFIALPWIIPNLLGITIIAGVGGLVMPWGIATLNALISKRTSGAERRAAFTVQTVAHSGGASVGLLVGGAIIGWLGAIPVLFATGILQVFVAVAGIAIVAVSASTSDHRRARETADRQQ